MYENPLKELQERAAEFENTAALEKMAELEKIVEAWEKFAETAWEIVKAFVDAVMPVIVEVIELAKKYPNKRVKHLAAHGKPRTRKKNINRIIKWITRKQHPNRKEAAEI